MTDDSNSLAQNGDSPGSDNQTTHFKRLSSRRWLVGSAIGVAMIVGLAVLGDVVGGEDENKSAPPGSTPPTKASSEFVDALKPPPDPNARFAARMRKRGWTQLSESLWVKYDGGEAQTFGVTWKVRVVSPTGCPNGVYLEANVLDTSKTVVGFTNDMLPSLAANQQAVLRLTSTASGRLTAKTTKASCY